MTVNEKTSITLTVTFRDENGALVVPSAATYRLDDVGSQTAILAATALSLASSVNVLITSTQNRILTSTNQSESREVTVEFDYTGGLGAMHSTDKYAYEVLNLYGVS